MNFTYREYKGFLEKAKSIAPTIYQFRDDLGPFAKGILLRHDVDFSIREAWIMAKIESMKGIRSTYFVMVTNPFYNIFSRENTRMLWQMCDQGHEIGLHFDLSAYHDLSFVSFPTEKMVEKECKILELVAPTKIVSISLHNPSVARELPYFRGLINAHALAPEDDAYFSDSCRDTKGKDPFQFVEKANNSLIQMLFHPMHWSDSGKGYHEYFGEYVRDQARRIEWLMDDNPGYQKEVVEWW